MMEKDIVIHKGTLVEIAKPVEISKLFPGVIITIKRGAILKVHEDVRRGSKYITCELYRIDNARLPCTISMQFLARNTRRVEE